MARWIYGGKVVPRLLLFLQLLWVGAVGGNRVEGQRPLYLLACHCSPFLHIAASPANNDGWVTPSLRKDGGAVLSWNLWIGSSEALEGRAPDSQLPLYELRLWLLLFYPISLFLPSSCLPPPHPVSCSWILTE